MACYRLTFHNQQVFETVVESAPVHGDDRSNVCIAVIYKVANGVRDAEPLHRVGGGPIHVLAVNEQTAVDIVNEVLKEITGSRLGSLCDCPTQPTSAPLPRPV
jgi:hypothetical protein